MPRPRPTRCFALASVAAIMLGLAMPSAARADDDDHRRGWRDGRGWHHDRDDDDRHPRRDWHRDRDEDHRRHHHRGRWQEGGWWHHPGYRPAPPPWGYAPWGGWHAPVPWHYRPGGYAPPAPPPWLIPGTSFQLSIGSPVGGGG